MEIEKRYSIKIGQTDVKCVRCGKSCWPGNHTCQDIHLEKLHEVKRASIEKTDELCAILKRFEAKIVAAMLEVKPKQVSNWIQRGNIPQKYRDTVAHL